ncbi:hypothetical protein Tco_0673624 [Tanacetum coccineum]
MSMRVVYSLLSLVVLGRRNSKEHLIVMMTFMIKDTTEVTMETKNFPSIGDPFRHLPYVGGAIVGVNRACKKQRTLRSGRSHFHTDGSRSSGGFVSVNKSSGAGPFVPAGATPSIAYAGDATGPPR